jgi:hypothetical protein
MEPTKRRIVVNYEKLSDDLIEQIKLVYPYGFSDHLISFQNKEGKNVSALRFETFETVYLIRMSGKMAERIIEEDSDYDDDGNLKDDIREKYEELHSDVDYLSENDNYED